MRVYCDNCGKKASKSRKEIEKTNHSFCSKECYFEYKRRHPMDFIKMPKKQDTHYQNKLKSWADMRQMNESRN